jgi:prepilin-type N-terminal cleavage/methylation domain-containing protein
MPHHGSSRHGAKATHGFSVLELLLAISLMSVLLSIAVPNTSGRLSQIRTGLASKSFTSAHARAQATAMRFGKRTELHIDTSARRFWIEVQASASGASDTIGEVRTLPKQMSMASNRAILCFDSRGLATPAGSCEEGDATVVFDAQGVADTVRFSVLGRVLR